MENDNLKFKTEELKDFLFEANQNGYAGEGVEISPERFGFKEIEYKKGNWCFRDSYAGYFFAPGQEVVYYKNELIWAMAYAGGMDFSLHGDQNFASQTFDFLKKALLAMDKEKPFRGPEKFKEGDYRYESSVSGEEKDFFGEEKFIIKRN